MRGPSNRERPIYSLVRTAYPVAKLCVVLATIEREWGRIVGDDLARRSTPSGYANGVLRIAVDSQAALYDMNFKKNAIAREIRAKARLEIESIKIEIGSVWRSSAESAMPGRRPVRTVTVDETRVGSIRDEILGQHTELDPELARCIARLRVLWEKK